MKEYVKICRNMTEYVENIKEYMKEYEEICLYIGSIWALGHGKIPCTAFLWDLENLPLYMSLGTWKNSMPELPPALGLGEIPRRSLLLRSGTLKNSELCLYTGSGI